MTEDFSRDLKWAIRTLQRPDNDRSLRITSQGRFCKICRIAIAQPERVNILTRYKLSIMSIHRSGNPATAGIFNLLETMGAAKELLYQLEFEHHRKPYFLDGRKYVRRGGEGWKDTTTLCVSLHEGRDASGPIAGAGILSLDASDFIRTLGTMRVDIARTLVESTAGIERSGKSFSMNLGQLRCPSQKAEVVTVMTCLMTEKCSGESNVAS